MVDDGKIAMRPAVEISFLAEEEQRDQLDAMELEQATPSHPQAIRLKKLSQEDRLRTDIIFSILNELKPNQVERVKIAKDKISKNFDQGTSPAVIEETIIKALGQFRKQKRSRGQEW